MLLIFPTNTIQGEVLAHILNGVINKPVRDALLLKQALSHTKHRPELLTSRLLRYHWDRPHFERVKREYRQRYGVELSDAVRENTSGEWGEFLEEVCVKRVGDEVAYVR
jgi:hypothetical protein